MSRTLPISQKLEPLLLESQKPHQREIRIKKIKKTIEAAITPTKVARVIEAQVTALGLRYLIIQQIDEKVNHLPDAAVNHTISASAILH